MIEFLLTIIAIVLLIVLAVIGIGVYILSKLLGGFGNVRKIFMKLTGWGNKARVSSDTKEGRTKKQSSNSSSSSSGSASSSSSASSTGGKIFNSNEGTYVDFEEIK